MREEQHGQSGSNSGSASYSYFEAEQVPLTNFLSFRKVLLKKQSLESDLLQALTGYERRFSPRLTDFYQHFWVRHKYSLLHMLMPYRGWEGRRDFLTFLYSVCWARFMMGDVDEESSSALSLSVGESLNGPLLQSQGWRREFGERNLYIPVTALFFIFALYESQPSNSKHFILCEPKHLGRLLDLYAVCESLPEYRESVCTLIVRLLHVEKSLVIVSSLSSTSGGAASMDDPNSDRLDDEKNVLLRREKQLYQDELMALGYSETFEATMQAEEAYCIQRRALEDLQLPNELPDENSAQLQTGEDDNERLLLDRWNQDKTNWPSKPNFVEKIQDNFNLYYESNVIVKSNNNNTNPALVPNSNEGMASISASSASPSQSTAVKAVRGRKRRLQEIVSLPKRVLVSEVAEESSQAFKEGGSAPIVTDRSANDSTPSSSVVEIGSQTSTGVVQDSVSISDMPSINL